MEILNSVKQLFRLASVVFIVLVMSACDITISDPIHEPAALLPIDTPTVIVHQEIPAPAKATVTEVINKANVTPSQKVRSTATQAASATATTALATKTAIATATAIPSPTLTPEPLVHVVRSGDTLTGIMKQYDVSLEALLAANPDLSEYSYLTIDQEIMIIPDEDEDGNKQEEIAMRAASPFPSPFPSASPFSSPSPFPTNTATPSGPPMTEEGHIIHFVQVEETISKIAEQYNVKRNDILLANGLRPDALLVAGDTLIIPQGPYTALPTAAPSTSTATPILEIIVESTATATATATKKINTPTAVVEPTRVVTYTIASGDIASIIADQYDVTVEDLQQANPNLNLESLRIGDELVIPPPSEKEEEATVTATVTATATATAITIEPSATPTAVPPIIITHVVKAGETLRKIAEQNELAEDTLTEYNPDIEVADEELEEEMVVQVPVGTATSTPTVTPVPSLTPTPAPDYLAPILILPANGEKWVQTDEAKPLQLAWTSPGILQENEYYVLRLRAYGQKDDLLWSHSEWIENPYWEVPSEILAQVEGEVILKWDVLVMRLTSEPGVEPKTGEALSDKSETYELIYVRDIPKEP